MTKDNLVEKAKYLAIVAIDKFGSKKFLTENFAGGSVILQENPTSLSVVKMLSEELVPKYPTMSESIGSLLKRYREKLSKEDYPDIHVERVVEYYSSSIDNKHGREFIETYDYKSFCDVAKNKTQMQIENGLRKAKCSVSVFRNNFENRVNLTYIKHAKRYLKEEFYSKKSKGVPAYVLNIGFENEFND